MPVVPSNVLGAPWVRLKSAWSFVGGRTRLDWMPGTFTPGANAALTVRSAPIPSEGTECDDETTEVVRIWVRQ
jgi:hypothetical protein